MTEKMVSWTNPYTSTTYMLPKEKAQEFDAMIVAHKKRDEALRETMPDIYWPVHDLCQFIFDMTPEEVQQASQLLEQAQSQSETT